MPRTVAVIGASADRRKFGNKAVRAFHVHGETVIPVNPHESVIEGLTAYPSVLAVPGRIDMATRFRLTITRWRLIKTRHLRGA